MQIVVLNEECSSRKQHQVNKDKKPLNHLGPKIWDCIDHSLYELSSFTFKKTLQRYPTHCLLSLGKWCWCFTLHICLQSFSLYSKLFFFSCTYSCDFYTWNFFSFFVWLCDLFFFCVAGVLFVLQEEHVRLSGSLLVAYEVLTQNFQNTRAPSLYIPTICWLHRMTLPHSITAANICTACQNQKGYDNPGRVSF